MNILFVVNSLSEFAGANVNIIRNLVRIIKRKQCQVYVLAKSDCRRPASEKIQEEFDASYLLPSDRHEIISKLYEKIEINNKRIKEIIWAINHPGVIWKGIDCSILDAYWTRREYTKCIEKICKERRIDAVIGVAAPYYIVRAVSDAKVTSIKAAYQMDPYTNNYTLCKRTKARRKKVEKKTIDKLDILFLPDFVKDDLINSRICDERRKMVDANLPCIVVDKILQLDFRMETCRLDDNINLVFAGRLYDDIRNPGPLLQLLDYMPSNFRLHIFGYGCEKQIAEAKKTLGDKLIYHGWVAKGEADDYVKKADILVNIDNTIKNQMPSKTIDYICQRKKIINICISRDCLGAKLLSHYSRGLNVYLNEGSLAENAENIIDFVKNNSQKVSTEEMLDKYKTYTDYYVANIILDSIIRFKTSRY